MLVSLTSALAFLSLALPQSPQALSPSRIHPLPMQPRDAGIFHVASGTWTRKAATAELGADVIYNNTCNATSFASLGNDVIVDEGRIPSPTSPTNATSRPGCATSYQIDGFSIQYCVDVSSFTYQVNFYEQYASCTSSLALAPTASFALTQLPASSGGIVCWSVTLDLDAPPQSASLAFVMRADGDGAAGLPGPDTFGVSFYSNTPGQFTGPVIAGNPSSCAQYSGTRWDPATSSLPGTGMGNVDQVYLEGGASPAGCYFFGGAPFAGLALELFSDACDTPSSLYCFGDGSGTACPCGNASTVAAQAGCTNSIGTAGALRSTGIARLSQDTVTLLGSGLSASNALYFQGTTRTNGGSGSVFGDGLRCASGTIRRLGTATGTTSQYPNVGQNAISVQGQIVAPGTRTYQAWYRNAASFCTSATFNTTNGLELVWTL